MGRLRLAAPVFGRRSRQYGSKLVPRAEPTSKAEVLEISSFFDACSVTSEFQFSIYDTRCATFDFKGDIGSSEFDFRVPIFDAQVSLFVS